MNLPRRHILFILMALSAVFLLIYGFIIFPRQKGRDEKTKAKIAALSKEVEAFNKRLETEKKALETLLSQTGRLPSLATGEKPFQTMIPSLLGRITRSAAENRIKILEIVPLEEKVFEHYLQHPFRIRFKTTFAALIRFVNGLETDIHLYLDRFELKSMEKEPGLIAADCTFNAYEIRKKDLFAEGPFKLRLAEVAPVRVEPVFSRDPFLREMETARQISPRRRSFEKSYVLKGIIRFQQRYRALINKGVYKEGDSIDGRTIRKITEDRVFFDGNFAPLVLERERG